MKTNIFYAMNEIDDKYILEAAQCLEHKNTGRNYRLNRDKCLNNKWMTHIVAAILIIVFVFTTGMPVQRRWTEAGFQPPGCLPGQLLYLMPLFFYA